MKTRITRRGAACWLAGMLLLVTMGCRPADTSSPATSTNKASSQKPSSSGKPGVQPPKPDLGK